MTTELRVLREDEFDRWFTVPGVAFGGTVDDEEREMWRARVHPGRTYGVWDGEEAVGSAGSFGFRMTVPGGAAVPTAGVTLVAVKPTHRRRGLLTAMMRRQLDDLRAAGEPLAALWPSEPDIYGRFGYAMATRRVRASIDTVRVRLDLPPGGEDVRLRMAEPGEEAVLARCEELYARTVPERPGMLERLPGWARTLVLDPPAGRDGASGLMCVLAERDGELAGYARYRVRLEPSPAGHGGEVRLQDMAAPDPAVYGTLLRYLCGIDLTERLALPDSPVDAPWTHLVSDLRRCGPMLRDGLQLRLVDLPAALEARTYAAPLDVVFEVEDAVCPWNAGRWRLTGGAGGATCVRTDAEAGLALSVRELASAYLGEVRVRELAGAGRVREVRAGAVAEASQAFVSDVAPWVPHGF